MDEELDYLDEEDEAPTYGKKVAQILDLSEHLNNEKAKEEIKRVLDLMLADIVNWHDKKDHTINWAKIDLDLKAFLIAIEDSLLEQGLSQKDIDAIKLQAFERKTVH